MKGLPLACSWSGGKDSCLALHSMVRDGAVPRALLTVFDESGERSRSHGLHREVLLAQAEAMSVPLHTTNASWSTYKDQFVAALDHLRAGGVADIAFGDIDLQSHREWEEQVCEESSMRAHLPLWQQHRRDVLRQVWSAGIRCHIVAIDAGRLAEDVLGAELTPDLATAFMEKGVDACGENGEFHTVVVDAPLFRQPIDLVFGEVVSQGGYLAIDARVPRLAR